MSLANNLSTTLSSFGEEEIKRVLLEEGRELERIAKRVWQMYLDSYKPTPPPKGYDRTGKSMESIQLAENVERLSTLEWGIRLNFVDELAYHDSVFGEKQGHAIMLISSGWRVKRGWHRDIYRFGYYEGFDVVGKILRMYNRVKPPYIQVQFNWNKKYLR